MVVLLLDSAGSNLSVGLSEEGKLIDSVNMSAWQRQSELMIPEIDKMMKNHHLSRNDLQAVAVGIGPGSYTGVRIAVTIAKVIAVALDIPIYQASSLRILVDPAQKGVGIMNARSNRSYVGVYEGEKIILADTIMENNQLREYLLAHPQFKLYGDSAYLKLTAEEYNPMLALNDLLKYLVPAENSLTVNPVYLKD